MKWLNGCQRFIILVIPYKKRFNHFALIILSNISRSTIEPKKNNENVTTMFYFCWQISLGELYLLEDFCYKLLEAVV